MADRDIKHLHPDLQPLCTEFLMRCKSEKIPVFITETWRDSKRQAELWAFGRDALGNIVNPMLVRTHARPGQSKHEFMMDGKPAAKAFDVGLKNADGTANWDNANSHWLRMGEIGEELGLTWGGRWPGKKNDMPHFQIN